MDLFGPSEDSTNASRDSAELVSVAGVCSIERASATSKFDRTGLDAALSTAASFGTDVALPSVLADSCNSQSDATLLCMLGRSWSPLRGNPHSPQNCSLSSS